MIEHENQKHTRIHYITTIDIDHCAGLLQIVRVLHADVDDRDVEHLAAVVFDNVLDFLSLTLRNATCQIKKTHPTLLRTSD